KQPIVVGGTGLYLQSLVFGLEIPKVGQNNELRSKLEKLNAEELHQMIPDEQLSLLNESDRMNPRRLVRIIEKNQNSSEVIQIGGTHSYQVLCIMPDIADLEEKLKARVQEMWEMGLVDEVKTVLGKGFP